MTNPLTGGNGPSTEMARALLEYANRQKVADALTERGYSVTRMTVNRWARGSEMPPIAARMIEELFGHTQSETPRPRWAEGLEDEIAKRVASRLTADPVAIRSLTETMERLDSALQEVQHGDVG